jgi:hypothetical protein
MVFPTQKRPKKFCTLLPFLIPFYQSLLCTHRAEISAATVANLVNSHDLNVSFLIRYFEEITSLMPKPYSPSMRRRLNDSPNSRSKKLWISEIEHLSARSSMLILLPLYRIGDLHPKTIVSPTTHEEFLNSVKSDEDGSVVYDTSAKDARKINEILGAEIPLITMSFPPGEEYCKKCRRKFSFLDILQTGLQTRDKEFWKNLLTGKRGYVHDPIDANPDEPEVFNCYQCGQPNRTA